ncbi:hypothetical protein LINPERPRIM_LOCUS6765 [Linum perenne]
MKEEMKDLHGNTTKSSKQSVFLSALNSSTSIYLALLLLSFFIGYFSASSDDSSSPLTLNNNKLSSMSLPKQLDNFRVTTQCAQSLSPDLIRHTLIHRIYNGTSPFHDFPPPYISDVLRRKKITGWGSHGAVFRNLIEKIRPKVIIEVGTFLGASAVHMANITRQLGLDSLILCIDNFRGWPGFQDDFSFINNINGDVLLLHQFMQNAVTSNVSESIVPLPFSTGSALAKMCEWGVTADLIEIDAGHEFNSAWSDINRAYRLLRPGGIMFGHDYFLKSGGVRRAVDLFAQIYGFTVTPDGQHWVLHTS